jgi:hypothetical protein
VGKFEKILVRSYFVIATLVSIFVIVNFIISAHPKIWLFADDMVTYILWSLPLFILSFRPKKNTALGD